MAGIGHGRHSFKFINQKADASSASGSLNVSRSAQYVEVSSSEWRAISSGSLVLLSAVAIKGH